MFSQEVGWWTYEVCWGRRLLQLHFDNRGLIDAMQLLGTFPNNIAMLSGAAKGDSANDKAVAHIELIPGDVCGPTGLPRQSTIVLECGKSAEPDLRSVIETRVCEYVITISISLACTSETQQQHQQQQDQQQHQGGQAQQQQQPAKVENKAHEVANKILSLGGVYGRGLDFLLLTKGRWVVKVKEATPGMFVLGIIE